MPNRATYVTELTTSEMEKMFEVRMALENAVVCALGDAGDECTLIDCDRLEKRAELSTHPMPSEKSVATWPGMYPWIAIVQPVRNASQPLHQSSEQRREE